MNNPEKLATQDTHDTENKHNTTMGTTTHKQPQTTQNQEEKTNRTSFLCGNRNGNHKTELKTLRHIIGQHKTLKKLVTRTPPKDWGERFRNRRTHYSANRIVLNC